MIKPVNIIFLTSLVLLLSINLILSQPPFVQNPNLINGYVIKFNPFGLQKQGVTQRYTFHVFNISTGLPINKNVSCYLHIYRQDYISHVHIATTTAVDHDYDYEFLVSGGNFTELGDYSYIIQCNSSTLGGFENIEFKVTPSGKEIDTSQSVIYLIIMFAIFFFFVFNLFVAIITPYKDKLNAKGEIIELMPIKYIKLFAISMSYLFFILFLNSLVGLSENYIELLIFSGFIGFLFTIFMYMSYPFMVVILVIALFQVLIDIKNKRIIENLGSA